MCVTSVYSQQEKDSLNIKDSLLPSPTQELKEVEVVAKKKLIEMRADRMIINVDAAVTNTGTNAMEVLEKTPGITVDKDGNISLKGKQQVMVMIDDRPTYLSAEQLANFLRGMESSQLDQIEIMTNPPARYDASGNSGIINIKTKKNKNFGLSGSVTAGITQSRYLRTNENISLSYRKEKFNLFANYSFSRNQSFNTLEAYRRYFNDDKSTRAIFDQSSFINRKSFNNNLKLGADYYVNTKTTLGIVLSGVTSPDKIKGSNTTYLNNHIGELDSMLVSSSSFENKWRNGSVNANLRHKFDTSGRNLTIDIDAIFYYDYNHQQFANTSYTKQMIKQGEEKLLGLLPMNISIYSIKSDYTHPFSKKTKMDIGIKSSYVENNSKAQYYNITDQLSPDYDKTNFYIYRENINAGYVNLNSKLNDKWEIQTGLRFENTNYNGRQYGNPTRQDSLFNKTYNSLFPTIFVSHHINKHNTLTANIGRRIDRPQYGDLNPFLFFIDRYIYQRGNPYLRPQFTNNAELSHTYKGFLTTTLNYSKTKDLIGEVFEQEGDYATIQSRGNYGRRDNAGIAVSVQVPITSLVNSTFFANYNYTIIEGMLLGEKFEGEAGNILFNINNQFSFSKSWSAELSGWYRSKGIEGQIIIFPMGAVTAGIAKQVAKNKGTLKLSIRDAFYTQPARGTINFQTTEATFRSAWDSRQLNLSFSYRFGKKTSGNARHQQSTEEQNRVKSTD